MEENKVEQRKIEKYLPVGTVVLLKDGKKRVMIIGFCVKAKLEETKMYDYAGCLYPEGVISVDKTCLFDHHQIDKIYHFGLVDEEEKKFKENLNELIKKIDNNEKEGNIELQ